MDGRRGCVWAGVVLSVAGIAWAQEPSGSSVVAATLDDRAEAAPIAALFGASGSRTSGAVEAVPAYQNIGSYLGAVLNHGDELGLDDVAPVFAGGTLETLAFSVGNLGTTNAYTGGAVRLFIAPIEAGFMPGVPVLDTTVDLGQLFGGNLSIAPGSVSLLRLTGFSALGVELPAGDYFVGLSFEDAGGADSVDVLGQGLFDPPVIGVSSDAVYDGADLVTLGGPSASFGWEIGVLAEFEHGDYTFDFVPVPSTTFQLFRGGLAINDAGQVAVQFEDENDDGYLYMGDAASGRTFFPPEPSSSSVLGPISLTDAGTVFYSVPFTKPGFARGAYAVEVDAGGSRQITATSPTASGPMLLGNDSGGVSGHASLGSPFPSARVLVTYPGGASPQAPTVIAGPGSVFPGSDIQEIDFAGTRANDLGQIIAIVELVTGGEQVRIYDTDGSFVVAASDVVADAASPILRIQNQANPALNNRGEALFLVDDLDGRRAIYKFDADGLGPALSADRLARAGILFVPFDDLRLNDAGEFAFTAQPTLVNQSASRSLWLGTLDGGLTQVVRVSESSQPNGAGPISTIDAGDFAIEFIDENPAINRGGRILFVGEIFPDAGGIDDYAFLAVPANAACRDADTNLDGVVDGADLLAVINTFGATVPANPGLGDVNDDGVVDGADLLGVINSFGSGC